MRLLSGGSGSEDLGFFTLSRCFVVALLLSVVAGVGAQEARAQFMPPVPPTPVPPTFGSAAPITHTFTPDNINQPLSLPEATDGSGALTYEVSSLPSGLMYDAGQHAIVKCCVEFPATVTNGQYTLTATGADGAQATWDFHITVEDINVSYGAPDPFDLVLIAGEYFDDDDGRPGLVPFATGGNGRLVYSLSPPMPTGLRVNFGFRGGTDTDLFGRPHTAQGRTTYTVTATDEDGDTDTFNFHITIEADTIPDFSTAGTIDATFTSGMEIIPLQLPEPTGGNKPLMPYVITSGSLPHGLVFNALTRTISGTPVGGQERTRLVMTAIDIDGDTAEFTFHITVEGVAFVSSPVIDRTFLVNSEITPIRLPEANGVRTLTYTTTNLPAGLSFDPVTRRISGTPTIAQEKTAYTLTATDGVNTATYNFHITVENILFPHPPVIDKLFIVGAEITAFQLPEVTGASGLTYTTTALPMGLSFNSVSRRISGTPTATQARTGYTLMAVDGDGNRATYDFYITVVGESTPLTFGAIAPVDWTFTPENIVNGLPLPEAVGGTGHLTYALIATPSLPTGLVYDSRRHAIVRRDVDFPVVLARTQYVLTATDADGVQATWGFHITVEDINVSYGAPDPFDLVLIVDEYFDDDDRRPGLVPFATGGNGRLVYSLSPPMPTGLRVNFGFRGGTDTDLLGRPRTIQGRTTYTVTATDEDGDTDTYNFHITIEADMIPDFSTAGTIDATFTSGTDITPLQLPESTDGNGPLTYALTSGALPQGLIFNTSTRTISGTPVGGQERTRLVMTATDRNGDTAGFTFHIMVEGVAFASSSVIDRTFLINSEITPIQLPEAKGIGTLTYTTTALPPGLNFDPVTRRISGTPTNAQTKTTYTLTATDGINSATYYFHITVDSFTFASPVIERIFRAGAEITPIQLPETTSHPQTLTYTTTALPPGLSFDPVTRRISGTPTTTQERRKYTLTATDGVNSATFDFYITVEGITFARLPGIDKLFIVNSEITPIQMPEATNGMGALTYSITALPQGLIFDPVTRRISGTPTATQTRTKHTLTATDGAGMANYDFHIEIEDEDVRLTFGSIAPIDWTFTPENIDNGLPLPEAVSGKGRLTYKLNPSLPEGLIFDPERRAVVYCLDCGVAFPVTVARIPYVLTATDEEGNQAAWGFLLTVEDLRPTFAPVTVDETLVRGNLSCISLPQAIDNGHSRYVIRPFLSGFRMDHESSSAAALVYCGVPNTVRPRTEYAWIATDSDGDMGTFIFHLTVEEDLVPDFSAADAIDMTFASGAEVNLQLPEANSGNGDLIYTITSGTLPPGLVFNTFTRRISGTPRQGEGKTQYTLTAFDVNGDSDTYDFHLTVEGPAFGSPSAIDRTFNIDREIAPVQLPEATGGTLTYTTTALPTGLVFNEATRRISGTPTAPQSRTRYTLTATDMGGNKAFYDFYIAVREFTFGSPPAVDKTFSSHKQITAFQLPEATGASGTLTYTTTALPEGLSFDSATRRISGTPTTEQARTLYTLTATDGDGVTAIFSFHITIRPNSAPIFRSPTAIDKTYELGNTGDVQLPPAEGGNGELIYTIMPPLPYGLVFNSVTHSLVLDRNVNLPSTQSRKQYTLTATDEDGDMATFTFTITVEDISPDFGSQTVDEELTLGRHGRVDLPFATGGNGGITYTISHSLPTGLRFIPSAHVIDGTPDTAQGRTTYTLTATDRDGDTDQMTFALTVVDTVGPPPEIPQLTVSPGTPTATEGGTLTFSLVLSHTTTETVTVGYTLTDDTATHGMDYTVSVPSTATSGMLTFEPGETLQTVVLSLIDDNEDETDETVMLTLNNLSSSANFPSCAICITPSIISVGTITDNDENTQPVFASSSPIDNTFSANKEISPFQLPEATGGDGTLTYSIIGGLPTGLSFDPATRTISGTPTTEQGRTEYTLTVGDSDGDTSAGDADTFDFHITVEQNTAPDFGSQTLDVELLLGRYGSINLPLARDGSGNGRIDYEITPALPSGLLYFSSFHRIDGTPDTAQGRTTYTLTATDRDGDTDQMTFSLTVVSPQLTFSPGTLSATEGGTLTFSLVLSHTTTEMVTVAYALTDDTATHGMDYTVSVPSTATSGMLTFEPGETSQTVVLSLIDDNEDETDETVMLTLSNLSSAAGFPGGVASITSVGTITDNDTNTAPVFDSRPVIEETLVRNRDTDLPLSLPEVDGDSGNGEITYSITPDLPTGLAFDSGTLAITGVPTVLQGPTEYTLTAGDSDGDTSAEDTDTFTFSITVEEDRQPVFAERTLDVTFVRGNFKQVPLPTVEGNGDITYAIDPSPPSGLNLTVNTLHGRPDTAQPRSEYTITAMDKDGDMATMTLYITISETPQLTVSASSPTIAEHGGALTFSIALDSAAPETVTVDYALTGTAQPGPDYTIDAPLTSAAGVLVFSPGSALQQTIVLSLVDDKTHEKDETVVLTLNNLTVAEFPGGADTITSVVTITDNDEDPNAFIQEVNTQVLPKIAMTIASEAAGAIRDRIKEAFSGVSSGVYVRGGGWRQFLAAEASRDNERAEMPDIKLSDLSFALAADEWGDSDYDYGGGSIGFRAWGRGYYHDVDFGGDIIFDGGITGGMVGVDTMIMSNLLTGVSANLFNADINFSRSGSTPRAHETTAWSVHPYIGWRPLARTTIWGTAGYGMGDIKVEGEEGNCADEGNCHNSDINLLTLGGGGSVLIGNVKFGSGRVSLDMLGDVALARISEGGSDGLELDAGVARFGIEMGYGRPLGLNGNLGGDIGLSYRADFGDIKSGSGLEAGGGLNITIPGAGLRFEGNGRALLSGIDSVDEWGFSGDIIWSYNSDNGTGPYIIFRPEWGATNDKRDDLWERGVAELEVTEDSSGQRYVMEAGYGVALMGDSGVMTFFARNEMEGGETALQSGGLDIEMTGGLSVGYETVSRTSEQFEHRGYLRYAGKF